MDNLFFVLSKLAWTLLSPSSLLIWSLLLVCLMLWLNYTRAARRLLTVISLLAFLVMAYPVSDWLIAPLENRFQPPQALPESVDGIIVLGGAESLRLSAGREQPQVGDGAERILAAAELSRRYPDVPLIYSGGSNLVWMPELDKDGQVSLTLIQQAGVAPQQIVMETTARNTHENFLLLKPLLPDLEGTYLLVTSAFHMPRSVGIARKQGVNVIPYPVDYRAVQPELRYWDFDLFAHLQVLEVAWREWIGLTAYFVSGKTSAWLPSELGETVD
jgi:uncharacterized SAM-binding protein YcdF (DUF218 family)